MQEVLNLYISEILQKIQNVHLPALSSELMSSMVLLVHINTLSEDFDEDFAFRIIEALIKYRNRKLKAYGSLYLNKNFFAMQIHKVLTIDVSILRKMQNGNLEQILEDKLENKLNTDEISYEDVKRNIVIAKCPLCRNMRMEKNKTFCDDILSCERCSFTVPEKNLLRE
jgi:hypothetical protein